MRTSTKQEMRRNVGKQKMGFRRCNKIVRGLDQDYPIVRIEFLLLFPILFLQWINEEAQDYPFKINVTELHSEIQISKERDFY